MEARTPDSAPPISPELWARLRRFDPHCDIWLSRTDPKAGSPWEGCPRIWVVTSRRVENVWEVAQAQHPALAEALRVAVEEGERRGWARA